MLVIGFGYKARRGKDTVCREIAERRGARLKVRQYAFADALRSEIHAALFDVWAQQHRDRAYDPFAAMILLCEWAGVPYDINAAADPVYPYGKQRALYQWWGTEYRRNQFGQDYWLRRLDESIQRDRPDVALISDVRFPNELEYVRSVGGYTVRLDREGFEIADGSRHVSEVGLDALPASAWSHVIAVKDGELERLKSSALLFFDSLFLVAA